MSTKYSVQVDGGALVNFEVDGEYISDTFEVDGDEVRLDSIADVERFLTDLLDAAEDIVSKSEGIPKVRVKTAKGNETKSKKIVEAVKRVDEAFEMAMKEAAKRREVDEEISRLMIDKIEREDEDDRLIALLVA